MRPKGILKCRYIFSSTYPVTPRKEDEHLHNIFSISNDKGTYLFCPIMGPSVIPVKFRMMAPKKPILHA